MTIHHSRKSLKSTPSETNRTDAKLHVEILLLLWIFVDRSAVIPYIAANF
jgi:hypothetical protein